MLVFEQHKCTTHNKKTQPRKRNTHGSHAHTSRQVTRMCGWWCWCMHPSALHICAPPSDISTMFDGYVRMSCCLNNHRTSVLCAVCIGDAMLSLLWFYLQHNCVALLVNLVLCGLLYTYLSREKEREKLEEKAFGQEMCTHKCYYNSTMLPFLPLIMSLSL